MCLLRSEEKKEVIYYMNILNKPLTEYGEKNCSKFFFLKKAMLYDYED